MNELDNILAQELDLRRVKTYLEKTAFDRHLQNLGVGLARYTGAGLKHLQHNPIAASAIAGGVAGGAGSMYASEKGERLKRLGQGVVGGAIGGGMVGLGLKGAVKNVGRYGEALEEAAKGVRQGGKDAVSGDLGNILRFAKAEKDVKVNLLKRQVEEFTDLLENTTDKADRKEIQIMRDSLKQQMDNISGGRGGSFGPLATLGAGAAATTAGVVTRRKYKDYREKNAHLESRLYSAVSRVHEEKNANIFAKGLGYITQGAGKAISAGAANPALAGAALGAGTGALAAGEGNRLKGALGGAALGAGAGVGLAKLAPQSVANMQAFGTRLGKAGKMTVERAKVPGVNFADSTRTIKKTLTGDKFKFAKDNITKAQGPVMPGMSAPVVTQGMSGLGALGVGAAGVGAAGAIGGYGMRGKND